MRNTLSVLAPVALAALALLCAQPAQGAPLPSDAFSAGLAPQQQDVPTVAEAVKINPTTVEVRYQNGQRLTVDFYGENIFRLFLDPQGGILRDPQATPQAHILVPSARRGTGGVCLRSAGSDVVITTPRVELRLEKQTGLWQVSDLRRAGGQGETVLHATKPLAFDKGKTTLTLAAATGEYFYGGGVQNGRFSHRGTAIDIENTNNWVDGGVASPTPFYWSTAGYGILWNTFRPGRYDFGATEPQSVILSHQEDYLDLFVMVNPEPQDLLSDFYQLTGNPVLLPKFGFYEGHLNAYNRDFWTPTETGVMPYEDGKYYKESQKDNGGVRESLNGELPGNYQFSARAAIDRYLDNDMPLGWFLPNDGYGAGYGQTSTLDGNIANLRSFGDYARSKGVEIGLWTQSDLHPKQGIEALLQRDIVKEVRDAGVRVLKTDVAWVGYGYSFGLNGVQDVGEVMPYYGSNARPFIISLDGWAGTQRYAGIWSGDQTGGDWEYIRFHIPTFIGSGLSGQPNITSDVDGIFGGRNVPVNVREFQWKTFTPMELNMDGWGANPKYPHALGEPATSINRTYLKLKSELLPYTYTYAHEAVTGKPLIRAMMLDYPNDYTLGSATQYQYMYGPSLLVAPVYRETEPDKDGNDVRHGIYLPEGRWIDFFSGQPYEGGRIINDFAAPLWKLPVLVKADAILPMTEPNNNPASLRGDLRIYEIYAQQGTTASEYDDDGRTQDYLTGQSTRTDLRTEVRQGRLTLTISPTVGEFEGFEPQKQTLLRINVSQEPKAVTARIGGKRVKLQPVGSCQELRQAGGDAYYYCAAPDLNRFSTPGSPLEQVKMVKNPQIIVSLARRDVSQQEMQVEVEGFAFSPADPLRSHHGALSAPKATITPEGTGVFSLTPTWEPQREADFYEVDFQGQLYSTIQKPRFTFEGLTPETDYTLRLRAVNADGYSEWATVRGQTRSNPLEFAVRGIKAMTTCQNQGGQGVGKLFDFDEKTAWHTEYGKPATPFDLTADLRAVCQLDRMDYMPRPDAGNGTLLQGTISLSTDRQQWTEPVPFQWQRSGEVKTCQFPAGTQARYVRLHITQGVGQFGSGQELYIFRQKDSEPQLQGDINRDKRIDENDLTSYLNYTGLRRGDSDFDYVSVGDVNHNDLIDAYDISVVGIELDGGTRMDASRVQGSLVLTPSAATYKAGDELTVLVSGKDLRNVNALSFALPYDQQEWEYLGLDLLGMKDMVNLTYDRLHTNGQRALYPTFVNRGNNFLLDEGQPELFRIKLRAKRAGKFQLRAKDGMLVDRNLGVVKF